MASAMQLYAGFALLVIAIIAIIVLAALVSNLIGALRRRFGRTRSSRSATPASRSDNPTAPR
jgi:peptidoglycan/LPS O-acetylase OafA/YrhL